MATTRHAASGRPTADSSAHMSSPRRRDPPLDAESLLPLKGAASEGLDSGGSTGAGLPPPSPRAGLASPSGRTLSPLPRPGGVGATHHHLWGLSDRVVAGGAYCVGEGRGR